MVALGSHSGGSAHENLGGIAYTMLSGFNTNYRYRGVLFHVQTEDSGLENPHVITHLFHGGNIMVSEKQEYSHLLAEDDLEISVKKLMEGQHKKILKQLSRGEHDGTIGERLGPDVFLVAAEKRVDTSEARSATEEEPPSAAVMAKLARAGARRPSVAEPTVLAAIPTNQETEPRRSDTADALSKVFGERVVSEKPLDEVVLDYLVENARKRRRQPK
jgi:hypothetical protein